MYFSSDTIDLKVKVTPNNSKLGQIHYFHLKLSLVYELSEQLHICETDIEAPGMNHTRLSFKKRARLNFPFPHLSPC